MSTAPQPLAEDRPFSEEDVSSQEFWDQPFDVRDETFARLRRTAPVSWHPPRVTPEVPQEYWRPGFWAVVSHADITTASHHHELYSSSLDSGGILMRAQHPAYRPAPTFILMDPPDHTRYRQVMSKAFTPRSVARLTEQINTRAEHIVTSLVGVGEIDVVRDLSSRLPMLTVADLLGVPESLVEPFVRAGNNTVGSHDPDVLPPGVSPLDFVRDNVAALQEIGVELVEHRRRHPSDDLATALAEAEFDGQPLSHAELGSVMLLLSIAGNDTTKQTTSHTVVSLWRHPDQRAWLAEDVAGRMGPSVEEFLRHAATVIHFARNATQDTELGGQHIRAGDQVVLFYCSGNRDESVWDEPGRFDLTRPRRPHVGFGGGGVHYCLGNGIAKTQLRAIFSQVLTHLPHLEVGEPTYLNSDLFHAVKRLPAVA
jgi:cytochrome P450